MVGSVLSIRTTLILLKPSWNMIWLFYILWLLWCVGNQMGRITKKFWGRSKSGSSRLIHDTGRRSTIMPRNSSNDFLHMIPAREWPQPKPYSTHGCSIIPKPISQTTRLCQIVSLITHRSKKQKYWRFCKVCYSSVRLLVHLLSLLVESSFSHIRGFRSVYLLTWQTWKDRCEGSL